MILSAHTSNGGPHVARPEPLSTGRMLKLLKKRLAKVDVGELSKKKSGVKKIHRLRVATRKAMAALAVCKALLSKSDSRRVESALKAQRKALGQVRDWDVLISRVLCSPADHKADARCDLLHYLAGERKRAWRRARSAWRKGTKDVPWSLAEKSKRAKGQRVETAHDLFRRALREPLRVIRDETSRSATEAPEMESLHRLRIACKSLRYLLEYQQEITGQHDATLADSAPVLKALSEAQQRLGDLHDLARRTKLLKSGRRPVSKGVRKWVVTAGQMAESRLPEETQRYLAWQAGSNLEAAVQSLDMG